MKLGLVVTDERHGELAVRLLAAAKMRSWDCRCFLTDRGTLLLAAEAFTGSAAFSATQVSACELSIERYEDQGLRMSLISSQVLIAGQYQNAELVRNCDFVLVL